MAGGASTTLWPAPAKINLFLNITGRRADGYHELQTHFQFLDLADTVAITDLDDDRVVCPHELPGVRADDDLTVRAARLLKARSGCCRGAAIAVDKRIPMGGGLGGGSSDAATVLVALNVLWRTGLGVDELAALGLELGADVPVFVRGVAAFAEGVGERLTPGDAPERIALVVHPGVGVGTAAVFGDPDLTRNTPPIRIPAASPVPYNNDCEPVVRRLFPDVAAALDALQQHGEARLTGTGACVYLLCGDRGKAQAIAAGLPGGWQSTICRTLNRSPLLAALAAYRDAADG
ncbi:MAG: 4-(cytidine 5'-diphospho)-2-C-methyl-D-erythritol kinase [Gammaproteobacteria bacterium]|nr:4-(cytidine 5'-diphospho)-2-C-methyl-D-erythritol kinase [Gammaproteobacteria bacterium]